MRSAVVVLLIVLFAGPALAQSKEALAAKAYKEAKVLYEAGDIPGSLAKLREAYKYLPDPKLGISIARRLMDLDRPTEAAEQLRSIETRSRKLKKLIASDLAKLDDILAQPVTLAIETDPPGATVRAGEQPAAKTPVRLSMPRGLVVLTLEKSGYEPITDNVHLRGTKDIKKVYRLTPRDSKLEVELVGVDPEAEVKPVVTVADKVVPLGQAVTVAPGKHTVACGYTDGTPPTVLKVAVPAGKNAVVRCALPEPLTAAASWKTPVGWASVGSGAAALAAGVGILVAYAVEVNQYPEPQYTINSSAKPVAGGVVAGVGAGLVGMGLGFLLSR